MLTYRKTGTDIVVNQNSCAVKKKIKTTRRRKNIIKSLCLVWHFIMAVRFVFFIFRDIFVKIGKRNPCNTVKLLITIANAILIPYHICVK